MASEIKTTSMKQLRLENWGSFFLQRLQLLFAKGDSCDLTLKFVTGQQLKVHSLVLRTCTSHFDTFTKVDNIICLPDTLPYHAVFPIINFMYSGKLEFKIELHSQLLIVAKILNIAILPKLLNTPQKADAAGPVKAKPACYSNTPDNGKTSSQSVIQQETPNTSSNLFSTRKLPFWRKRTLPFFKFKKPIEEEPGPTRFVCNNKESTDLLLISSPSFAPLSFNSELIINESIKEEDKELERSAPSKRRIIESRLLTTHDSDDDDDHFEASYSSDEEQILSPPPATPPPLTLKPCLKSSPPDTEAQDGPPAKKVRFSLGPEEKENSGQQSSNHAKIIAEVLKKYPDLVKTNKNIKLKISAPRPNVENGSEGKASYVVVRPTVKSTPNSTGKQNDLIGPLVCEQCPNVKFDDYATFRKHLQEIHNERLDARVCDFCGYKSSKRNLHLYHLFTKHNVPPPKNITFPKCTECDYIALSENILIKHMNSHQIRCDTCRISLKTLGALHAHKLTCKSDNDHRNIICDLCKKTFKTNVSLNAHLKECQGRSEGEVTVFSDDTSQQSVEMIEVPIIRAVDVDKSNHALVQLPPGIILAENQNVALLPSSESEALNNVATGIATSIGLTVSLPQDPQTVILLEGNSEFFIQGNEQIVVHKHSNQEYIVPELLEGTFTSTANLSYGTDQVIYLESSTNNSNQSQVIHLEEINLSQPKPGTSSEEGKIDDQTKAISDDSSLTVSEKSLDNKNILLSQNLAIVNSKIVHKNSQSNVLGPEKNPINLAATEFSQDNDNVKNLKIGPTYSKFEKNNNDSQNSSTSENIISSQNICVSEDSPYETINAIKSKEQIISPSVISMDVDVQFDNESLPNINVQPTQNMDLTGTVCLITEGINNVSGKRTHKLIKKNNDSGNKKNVNKNKDKQEINVEENICTESLKDARDTDVTDKTGDEKVDSIVKDWGFDDEVNEEVVDDPDSKPLRPEIDIPL